MIASAAGILLFLVVAPAAAAQDTRAPAWATFDAIRLGAPIDELLAAGASCHSVAARLADYPNVQPQAVAPEMFAYSLPHGHGPDDSAAVRVALTGSTLCFLSVLNGAGQARVLAFERTTTAATVHFIGSDSSPIPTADSVRALLRRRWPAPTHRHSQLDTWHGSRYRAFLVLGSPLAPRIPQLLLVDVRACSTFDRRLHRASGRGTAEAC